MADIQHLLKMLRSNNPDERFEACEKLRVTSAIPPEALEALNALISDTNLDVADAAQRALVMHIPGYTLKVVEKHGQNSLSKRPVNDLVLGFLGWVVFHNLLFILALYGLGWLYPFFTHNTLSLLPAIMWFATIIVAVVVFAKQRFSLGTGIVAAVIINIGIWIVIWPQGAFGGFPLPMGILLSRGY